MDEIIKMIEERREFLTEIKRNKEIALENVPKGTMRISTSNGNTQFFHRPEKNIRAGIYIQQKDLPLAQALAQKDYDQKVLCSVEQELKAIEKYLTTLPKTVAEEIYTNLHKERQKLIIPIKETDEEYVQRWEQVQYRGKEISDTVPLLLTEKGERVRSKSEMMIADLLFREGIPYRYECPLWLNGFGEVYPDFTTLNVRKKKEIYWEHFGMMDDLEYVEKAFCKIDTYKKNGIVVGDNLIITWETKKVPLNQIAIRSEISRYFT